MNKIDLKLTELSDGTWDLLDGGDGDFAGTEGYDTALLTSILTDARALEAEVTKIENRRGWLPDLYPVVEGYVLGSLLWAATEQKKKTTENLNAAVDAVEKSLTWITDLNYAKSVDVSGVLSRTGAEISVIVTAFSGQADTMNFQIWKATVNGN